MSQMLQELETLGNEIVFANTADKKRSKASRHAGYRKKRISEATILWDNYNKKLIEVQVAVKSSDPCLDAIMAKYSAEYKEYTDRLLLIPVDDTSSSDDEGVDKYQIQSTRFETIKRVLSTVELKKDHNEIPSIAFINTKSKRITELWQRIELEDEQISAQGAGSSGDYRQKYAEIEILVENALLFLQENVPSTRGMNTTNDGVKLNRVEIPKFSGDYFKWITFRDLFESLVINNANLPNSQKMQMLKTHVTGEAEKIISDLNVSEANFNSAWQRLIARYDNNRIVVDKMITKLMGQPQCKDDSISVKALLDTTDQLLLALSNMGRPIKQWDDWIVVLVTQKLSETCHKDWEHDMGNSTELPTWDKLKEFLEKHFRMLERVEGNKRSDNKNADKGKAAIKSYQSSIGSTACVVCNEDHTLYKCPKWIKMEVKNRWTFAKKQKWCFLCLKTHTGKKRCDKPNPCKKCSKKHSTWLHMENEGQELAATHRTFSEKQYDVLLATAMIKTKEVNGKIITLRALIDSGSEGSMITEETATRLNLKESKSDKWITGLNGSRSGVLKKVKLDVGPRFKSDFSFTIECYILGKLTKTLPNHDLCTSSWHHIKGLVWADPMFNKKGKIDMLLGMDAIGEIMKQGFVKGPIGQPMAQETHLGWIMSGKIDPTYPTNELKCLVSTKDDYYELQRFWELEDLNPTRTLTPDEVECEQMYQDTYRQEQDGRFVVKLPFKKGILGPERLGESRGQAMARFLQLEKKFARDTDLSNEYKKVIQEYINLGHAKEVTSLPKADKKYYIPHHAVMKMDSLTTKTRVVFDASAKTTTGWSLNECMHTGAKQQKDLMPILLKWRLHKVVFKADIEKMYRMIQLDDEDQKYHTFIWRDSPTKEVQEYQMRTVTFGTAAAPFLATRTLKQLAVNIKDSYPRASACLDEDFYVDDLIGGSHTVEEAISCKEELMDALSKHNFGLRKWTSNSAVVLASLPLELTEKSLQTFTDKESTKALGIIWIPQTDIFKFSCNWTGNSAITWTKRQFLSEAAKLFDPLGWLAPVTVTAKLMMQDIWQSKIGWDEQVPEQIRMKWIQFRDELKTLENITINRWISYAPDCHMSLHGFSDASEKAYSAVIYARIKKGDQVFTQLITSKTRVAPITTKITLPRLELCGAVLVADLMDMVMKAWKLEGVKQYAWTDSTITLGWIRGEPCRWKTFVANRVAEIQSYKVEEWRHIPSEQNPADCASRGLVPNEILEHSLWWTGPHWLSDEPEEWPSKEVTDHEVDQRSSIAVNTAQITDNDTVNTCSSWYKLKRLAAYGRRFKTKGRGRLTAKELAEAEKKLIKRCQEESFPMEMQDLTDKKPINRKSKLKSLNVFLDNDGLMRVGGRLSKATISYETKHPIVLPSGHHLTKLVIRQMHLDTLHGGPKLMRGLLMKKFWILQAKRMIRNDFTQCTTCRRFDAETYKQQMGELPDVRVTLTRAFYNTGVDYAGPVEVKSSNLRNARIQKGYVAVYVCMGTRAVHLELVSDMTSESFLASMDRFIARRGLPAGMYSDNGTSFVGGANKLEQDLVHQRNQEIADRISNRGIEWHFIPEGSPNFGGIWERSVRSMKDHVKRTLKTARLTFEEYSTLLCQVEACMNSRPLCATSNDIEDMDALTPGHFLIGDALLAPPDPNLGAKNITDRKRWKYVQKLHRELWERWNQEYLLELQQRHKWSQPADNVRIGELVVVKDEDLPPRNWLLGRIDDIHPGKDGQVRVATVRIANRVTTGNKVTSKKDLKTWITTPVKTTTIKRPVRKLCPLLITEDEKAQPLLDKHEKMKQDAMKALATVQAAKKKKQPILQRMLRARPRGMTMTLVILGIILLSTQGIASSIKDCVKLMPFQNDAGIYFENLGRASMTRAEWNIIVYFDLMKYKYEVGRIQDTTTDLRALCHTASMDSTGTQCTEIVTILQSRLDDITQMNTLLRMNKQVHGEARRRRAAPLNIVGWIGHELFGIMDAERAEILERRITNLQTKQGYFMELSKKQTSIVELTTNLMKSSHEEMLTSVGSITKAIEILKNHTDLARKGEQILGWAMYTSLLIGRLESTQRNIINMLTDLQQGHISSYLFTPQQFKLQLNTINDQIPIGSKLPLDPQHDMKSFYEIMRGRMRVTEKKIILEITLPLVSIAEFQVFYIVPVPFQHEKEHMSIIPDSKYLLITLKRDMFYQMDDQELDECMKPQGVPIICQSKRPVNNILSTKSQCERELLAQGMEFSKHCRINVTQNHDNWIQLKEKNVWIYGLQNKTTLNLVYASNADTITLQGSGKMEVQPGCEVSQHGFTMIGEAKITTKGVMDFHPFLNLSKFIQEHPTDLKLVNVTMDDSQQFKEIYSRLEEMKSFSEHTQISHRHHYGVHMMFGIIAIIIGVWYARKKICLFFLQKCKQNTQNLSHQHGGQMSIEANDLTTSELNEISVDNDAGKSSTADRHGPGGCPFRT